VPVLEALISINNKLGQKEAAAGLLEWGQKNLQAVLRIRIYRIHMFLGLLDPDPDPLVRGMDPDPDPSVIKQIQ
jgi:hypothetical protein